ncbi:hypothetical protein RISK_002664 [Rhodopirellula islandica]|uniref:Uncharacterized protein n=1 Tax=Rhodopirellula islandica TaxID=595434 RepID=A0A0J1BFL6_RHOIS|nr:hypothetical protein RISK_002664 [Rhodopirellula islandica]
MRINATVTQRRDVTQREVAGTIPISWQHPNLKRLKRE